MPALATIMTSTVLTCLESATASASVVSLISILVMSGSSLVRVGIS